MPNLEDQLAELRTELVRSRGFIRGAETQLTKTLNVLDAIVIEAPGEPPEEPTPEPVQFTQVVVFYPMELNFTALGQQDAINWVVVTNGNDGKTYAPVELDSGERLWVEVEVRNGATPEDIGLWLHPGANSVLMEPVGFTFSSSDPSVVEVPAGLWLYTASTLAVTEPTELNVLQFFG